MKPALLPLLIVSTLAPLSLPAQETVRPRAEEPRDGVESREPARGNEAAPRPREPDRERDPAVQRTAPAPDRAQPPRAMPAGRGPFGGTPLGPVRQPNRPTLQAPRVPEARPMTRPAVPNATDRARQTAEAQERLGHLRTAVEHLRAAGINDAADRLAEQAEQMQQDIRAATEAARPRNPPAPATVRPIQPMGAEAIREELQELRQAVQQMNRRIEELSRR